MSHHQASDGSAQPDAVRHETITVGPGLRAFALGTTAGAEAMEALKAEERAGDPVSLSERAAFFWLACGVTLATKLPEANHEAQLGFIAGAAGHAPRAPLTLEVSNIDGAAFSNILGDVDEDGEPEFDEQFVRDALGGLLRKAAVKVEEFETDFALFDGNGVNVGRVKLNLWD